MHSTIDKMIKITCVCECMIQYNCIECKVTLSLLLSPSCQVINFKVKINDTINNYYNDSTRVYKKLQYSRHRGSTEMIDAVFCFQNFTQKNLSKTCIL